MNGEAFDFFATLLRQRSGLPLTRDKAYVLESRLQPVTRKWNKRTVDELAEAARADRDEPLLLDIVEALLPTETSFNRDAAVFTNLRTAILPQLATTRADTKTLWIWSAGCSTGQEAYSLALLFAEAQWQDWTIEIVATDLSHTALARARNGLYSQFEVQRGLSARTIITHFNRVARPDGAYWQLHEAVRQRVTFGPLNLLHDPAPQLALLQQNKPFDLILCRHVVSAFEAQMRTQMLEHVTGMLASDGMLLLGRGESADGTPLTTAGADTGVGGLYRHA